MQWVLKQVRLRVNDWKSLPPEHSVTSANDVPTTIWHSARLVLTVLPQVIDQRPSAVGVLLFDGVHGTDVGYGRRMSRFHLAGRTADGRFNSRRIPLSRGDGGRTASQARGHCCCTTLLVDDDDGLTTVWYMRVGRVGIAVVVRKHGENSVPRETTLDHSWTVVQFGPTTLRSRAESPVVRV